jgi:amino-acid N-acetyltransferase
MSGVAGARAVLRAARAEDLGPVLERLRAASLPEDGVAEAFGGFVVAEEQGTIVGAAGLERWGDYALLRSVVVAPEVQGRGVGAALVEGALQAAREGGARAVYLLTTTADGYFPRHGFRAITRAEVPAALQESVEFRSACPESAVVMVRWVAEGSGAG